MANDDGVRGEIRAMWEMLTGEEYDPEPCYVGTDHQVHKAGTDHSPVKLEFDDTLDAGMWAGVHPCAVVMCPACFPDEEADPVRPVWERERAAVEAHRRAALN